MKPSEFKKIIKEAVKEAIQEELKDILLEAVKTPKQVVRESYVVPQQTQPTIGTPPAITMDRRQAYIRRHLWFGHHKPDKQQPNVCGF